MTQFLQIIYDFYTIFTNLSSTKPIDEPWLYLLNLMSIMIITMMLSLLCMSITFNCKNHLIKIISGTAMIGVVISAFLSLLLFFEVPFLPNITSSVTHEHISHLTVKPNKKQIYTNKSNIEWRVIYYFNDPFGYITTKEFTRGDISSAFTYKEPVFVTLEGQKGSSTNLIDARLQKENIHITKTENAKKYPEWASYKITKIETKDGSYVETSFHQSRTVKFKELYLEIIADVQPEQLKDAKDDAQSQQNKKDINKLLK